MHTAERPHCFLFDNGSLRAASTLSLRGTARLLSEKIGAPVHAVSLLHSSAVRTEELDGRPAQLLEPALLQWLRQEPSAHAVLLPFFFGPSAAITEYVPERLISVRAKYPNARLRLARPLVNPNEPSTEIAEALSEAARKTKNTFGLVRPKVILVDHGSPQPTVAAVRNHLGEQVRQLLADEFDVVGVASMERRPGDEYHFNDPLLSVALTRPPFNSGDVIILLQFLSPGRHAGPNGDVAQICAEASRGQEGLRTFLTDPIANDERVVDVLVRRHQEAAQTSLRGSISPTSSA